MKQTYNPVEGPFEVPPPASPGRAVVIGTNAGFSLRETGTRRRLSAPDAAGSRTEPPPAKDPFATIGKSAMRGSAKLFAAAQQSSFGRKYLGGHARAFFLVDVSRRTIADEFALPTREGTLYFKAEVTCDVKIIDPVRAVADGITDVCRHLATELRLRLARVAAGHSARELAEAQNRMQALFDRPVMALNPIDPAILLERALVATQLDTEAQKWLREKEVSGLRRGAVEAAGDVEATGRRLAMEASESFDSLLAQWLATGDDRFRVAMEHRISVLHAGDERRRSWAELLVGKGVIEAHDLHARYPDLVDRVLGHVIPGAPASATPPAKPALPAPEAPATKPRVEIRLPRRP
jgi:hypothetical protein